MNSKLIAGFLLASIAAFGADHDFDQIVKAIESHYGTRQTHIPMMGLANFVVKAAHPEGVKELKLAVFDDLRVSAGDQNELDAFMGKLSPSGMRLMVQTRSRSDGESTYIFAGDPGKSTRMLVATFSPHDATVVEVKVNLETLLQAFHNPDRMKNQLGVEDHDK